MNITKAFQWLGDPLHYSGPNGIDSRVFQHLGISIFVLALASLIAIPIGLFIGHTGRGSTAIVAFAGGVRALPTLGLISPCCP